VVELLFPGREQRARARYASRWTTGWRWGGGQSAISLLLQGLELRTRVLHIARGHPEGGIHGDDLTTDCIELAVRRRLERRKCRGGPAQRFVQAVDRRRPRGNLLPQLLVAASEGRVDHSELRAVPSQLILDEADVVLRRQTPRRENAQNRRDDRPGFHGFRS